jgi:hypothetical protein
MKPNKSNTYVFTCGTDYKHQRPKPTDAHRRQAVCNPKMRNCRRIDPENAKSQCEAIAESANAPFL